MDDPFELSDAPAPLPKVTPPPAPMSPTRFLDGLNEPQCLAVQTVDGPVLVLAGAGTGKTRVLTTRLSHILALGRVRPWQVLAVTFTNKAAREMKDRVAGMLRQDVEGWWIGTFHALAARILRENAELVGLQSNFSILDDDDQLRLIKQVVQNQDLDQKRWPPRMLLGVIQRWKDRGLTPDKVTAADAGDVADGKAVALYREYQDRLRTLNATDFGDLLLHNLTLFTEHSDVLGKYQTKFHYILVDEYQDTNVAQYLWLRLLAQTRKNICCVGDDDQSIYSWRGAEVGNILRFEEDFPGATVVRLERNYRSTGHILAAASGLISHNEGRFGKTLWTEDELGEKVRVTGVWDGEQEARAVGGEIEAMHSQGRALRDMAILVRAGFQTREFEERFITLGVPYRVVGGQRFYERKEIRDATAYLRVIAQPRDDMAFERIINLPKRGIGKVAMQTIHHIARSARIPLTEAVMRLLETDELKPKLRNTLSGLMTDFARWRSMLNGVPHPEVAETVLDESGYMEMLRMDRAPDAQGRLENLKELILALEEFETIPSFLEHVSLVMENDTSDTIEKVTIMTLHGAKGLEFDTVFLPGWEDGLFPHQRAMDETGTDGLEEERRLAYVGLTRARRLAWVFHAANRRVYGQWQSSLPSRFIDELPGDHLRIDGQPGLEGGGRSFGGFSDGAGRAGPGLWNSRPASRPPTGLAGDGQAAGAEATGGTRYRVGGRIFHQKFGYGHIINVDGEKLKIAFDKAGTKKVLDSFVEPV